MADFVEGFAKNEHDIQSENISDPIIVKEDALKDQLGNAVYFNEYKEDLIPDEARNKIKEHIEKYEEGEYRNEASAIYISVGDQEEKERNIIVVDENNQGKSELKHTGAMVLFDNDGNPVFVSFSKEIDRINDLRIQAEKVGIDFLTGLHNRNGWEEYLNSLASEIQRNVLKEDQYITIFYGDLNNLKKINDTQGHEAGDEYIVKMANFLKSVFARDKDERARWGGDEYGVVTISNQPYEDIVIQRLEKFGSKDLSYSAGIGSFKIKDFLEEIGITDDMDREERARRIKEGLLKKFAEVDKREKEAKEYSKQKINGQERPTVVHRLEKAVV